MSEIKERPILISAPILRSALEGRSPLAILRHRARFDVRMPGHQWTARAGGVIAGGSTITVAACCAIAVRSLGDVIDIPSELI